MNAVVEEVQLQVSTQAAPSGPVQIDHPEALAANTPDIFVVSKVVPHNQWDPSEGFRTKFIGAYWNEDFAKTIAAMFEAAVQRIEIGKVPTLIRSLH